MTMRRHLSVALLGSTAAFLSQASLLAADTPTVSTDIAPVGGLVAAVMGDLGSPTVIVPAGTSPHDFSMRPSQARAMSDSNLVIWMGEALMPNFEHSIESLAGDAHVLDLSRVAGTLVLGPREDKLDLGDDHDEHGHDGHDDHDEHDHDEHDDHDEQDHDEHDDHDEHGEEGHTDHSGHDHDHSGADPHGWLSPENAKLWVGAISEELIEIDPANEGVYAENALLAKAAIDEAIAEADILLASSHDTKFVTFHDAYRYFENAFDLHSLGSISSGHAAPPSPAHLAELRDLVQENHVSCLFAEPQFNSRLVETIAEGTDLPVAVLDPLGQGIEMGPDFYPTLIVGLATSINNCGDQ